MVRPIIIAVVRSIPAGARLGPATLAWRPAVRRVPGSVDGHENLEVTRVTE
jgi:hypothetical protein